jgi:hypothetical protein
MLARVARRAAPASSNGGILRGVWQQQGESLLHLVIRSPAVRPRGVFFDRPPSCVMCVCVCRALLPHSLSLSLIHTHTHSHAIPSTRPHTHNLDRRPRGLDGLHR